MSGPSIQAQFLALTAKTDQHLVRYWLNAVEAPNTRRAYARVWRSWTESGRPRLDAVQPADLLDYRNGLIDRGLAPATINQHRAALAALFRFAVAMGHVQAAPDLSLWSARKAHPAPRTMSRDEIKSLRDECTQDLRAAIETLDLDSGQITPAWRRAAENCLLVDLCYLTGARISEVLSLAWNDIHIDGPEDDPIAGGSITYRITKSGRPRAVRIPAKQATTLVLVRHALGQTARPYERVWEAGSNIPPGPTEPIFSGRGGRPLSYAQAYRRLKDLARRAGLHPHWTPHWLRHAHALHALNAGAPIASVQASLGHMNLHTTARYLGNPDANSPVFLDLP